MDAWRDFRRRYRDVIEDIHERYPGFWTELRDLAESRERRRTTTRGATVRDFPRTQDRGSQASGGRTLGQCLFGVAAPELCDTGTQTEATAVRSVEIQADTSPSTLAAVPPATPGRERGRGLLFSAALRRPGSPSPPENRVIESEARSIVAARPLTRGSNVCWNCRASDHRYSDCPWPRDRQYCYGCGRDGVTLCTCPGCRNEWKDLGPYHPDRGHLGH